MKKKQRNKKTVLAKIKEDLNVHELEDSILLKCPFSITWST